MLKSPLEYVNGFAKGPTTPPVGPFAISGLLAWWPMSTPMSLRDRVAVTTVRLINLMSRRLGRGSGTVVGGRVGLRFSPTLLNRLAHGRRVVLVSGTNGKTTTAALLRVGWGGDVAANTTGSNMPEGLVAALAHSSSSRAVLEVDEQWLDLVVEEIQPSVIVLLNLSRDQLDRSSEVRSLAERWRSIFLRIGDQNPQLTVVANVNDPLVVYAAEPAAHVTWCDVPTTWLVDAASCPRCTKSLTFVPSRDWWCTCGFRRPDSTAVLTGTQLRRGTEQVTLELALPGEFNVANAAMALCALVELGEPLEDTSRRVMTLGEVAGRFSVRHWRGHEIRLALAKNPAGFVAMLSSVMEGDDDLWIAINDRIADGRDPSWLYDVPFELLGQRRVYCFGDRRLDLATRLDYADVSFEISSEETPPVSARPVTLIANYTAFHEWWVRTS